MSEQKLEPVQDQQQEKIPVQIWFEGGYILSGKGPKEGAVIMKIVRKPNFIHRFFCKVLLGWIWIDSEQPK